MSLWQLVRGLIQAGPDKAPRGVVVTGARAGPASHRRPEQTHTGPHGQKGLMVVDFLYRPGWTADSLLSS